MRPVGACRPALAWLAAATAAAPADSYAKNLSGLKLSGVDFKKANLSAAVPNGADLSRADLSGSVVRNPRGLDHARLDGVLGLP